MTVLTRFTTGIRHVVHGLVRQLPDRPYPSDHPWSLRHSRQ